MTKDEINQAYNHNCALIGDLEMKLADGKFQLGELEIQKDKHMTSNRNLKVDMEKIMKEEAKLEPMKTLAPDAVLPAEVSA